MEDKKIRVTFHNGRTTKNHKVFTTKHNDRNYKNVPDEELKDRNIYIIFDSETKNTMYYKPDDLNFDNHEQNQYIKLFQSHFDAYNAKQKRKDRKIDQNTYRKSAKSCPEETIFCLGNVNDLKGIDREQQARILKNIYTGFIEWQTKNGYDAHIKNLDCAIHIDENGAVHLQNRRVWVYNDENGNLQAGQNKALEQMHIPLPDENKKEGRYNNRKMTFTKLEREKLIEYAELYGFKIKKEPKEASKSGLSLEQYKTQQEKEKQATLIAQNKELEKKNVFLRGDNSVYTEKNKELKAEHDELTLKLKKINKDIEEKQKDYSKITEDYNNELLIRHRAVENYEKGIRATSLSKVKKESDEALQEYKEARLKEQKRLDEATDTFTRLTNLETFFYEAYKKQNLPDAKIRRILDKAEDISPHRYFNDTATLRKTEQDAQKDYADVKDKNESYEPDF